MKKIPPLKMKAVEISQDAYSEVSSDGKYFRSVVTLGLFTDEAIADKMTGFSHQLVRDGLTKSNMMSNGVEAIEVKKMRRYDA